MTVVQKGAADLTVDAAGTPWAGVRVGVIKMATGALDWRAIPSPDGFSGDVLAVDFDGAGNLLAIFQSATAGGIYRLAPGSTTCTQTTGVTAAAIESSRTNLAHDVAGDVYFATGKTVYRFASGSSDWVALPAVSAAGSVTPESLIVNASNQRPFVSVAADVLFHSAEY